MTLYAAMYYDTDGFTYGCENTLGIYDSRAKADERLLQWCEEHKRDLDQAHVDERQLNEAWE